MEQNQHSTDSDSPDNEFYIEPVGTNCQHEVPSDRNVQSLSTSSQDWTVTLETNGTDVMFKIDYMAQANVLPLNTFKLLHK